MTYAGRLLAAISLAGAVFTTNAALVVNAGQTKDFFEGRKAVAVYSSGSSLYMLDFSQPVLKSQLICSDGATDYRSIHVSPDCKYVAYAIKGTTYVRSVQANSPAGDRKTIGAGDSPRWWIHPKTRETYLILRKPPNTLCQRLGPDLKPVGAATKLLGHPFADGGRSPDGRFIASADDGTIDDLPVGHGIYELEPPDAVENATVKTHVNFSSANGWPELHGGYCNGSISPSADPRSPFYASVLYLGSYHTDLFLRQYPIRFPPDKYRSDRSLYRDFYGVSYVYIDTSDMLHLKSPNAVLGDGNTHWHGSFYSWHNFFATAKGGKGKDASVWDGYLLDLRKLNRYLRFMTGELNKTNDYIHLWVEWLPQDQQTAIRYAPEHGMRSPAAEKSRLRVLPAFRYRVESGVSLDGARVGSRSPDRVRVLTVLPQERSRDGHQVQPSD